MVCRRSSADAYALRFEHLHEALLVLRRELREDEAECLLRRAQLPDRPECRRTRIACFRWCPVTTTNSSRIRCLSSSELVTYRSRTAVTSSRLTCLVMDTRSFAPPMTSTKRQQQIEFSGSGTVATRVRQRPRPSSRTREAMRGDVTVAQHRARNINPPINARRWAVTPGPRS